MEAVVCGIFDVFFDGKELKWQGNQLLNRDNPIDAYKPVAFDTKIRIYLNNGRIPSDNLGVDFGALEKRLSKDDYPPYISKER